MTLEDQFRRHVANRHSASLRSHLRFTVASAANDNGFARAVDALINLGDYLRHRRAEIRTSHDAGGA
jgi:hypothetical protein